LDTEAGSTIQEFNNILKANDDNFDFYLVRCKSTKKVLAIFWMTGAMRNDFELYGTFLVIDLCKKEFNCNLMPYIAATTVRDDHTIGPVIERLVIGDGHEWVKHMTDALFKMTRKRRREDVLVVAGDGAFSQDMVTNLLQFPNARFILDTSRWHLENACG
jgi:hypothetical protein